MADKLGWCFGVERAVDMAFAEGAKKDSGKVATLGPIIHNPQMVERLKEKNVGVVEEVNDLRQARGSSSVPMARLDRLMKMQRIKRFRLSTRPVPMSPGATSLWNNSWMTITPLLSSAIRVIRRLKACLVFVRDGPRWSQASRMRKSLGGA